MGYKISTAIRPEIKTGTIAMSLIEKKPALVLLSSGRTNVAPVA
jgi:hypothetical protein